MTVARIPEILEINFIKLSRWELLAFQHDHAPQCILVRFAFIFYIILFFTFIYYLFFTTTAAATAFSQFFQKSDNLFLKNRGGERGGEEGGGRGKVSKSKMADYSCSNAANFIPN